MYLFLLKCTILCNIEIMVGLYYLEHFAIVVHGKTLGLDFNKKNKKRSTHDHYDWPRVSSRV